jgi:hypothetical protein
MTNRTPARAVSWRARILQLLIATPDTRAKFEASFYTKVCRDLGNSSLKKIFAILNLASCL